VVSHHEVVRDTAEFGVLRMAWVLAAVLPGAALVQVLANAHDYRQPAVAVAVWLVMLAVAIWIVPRIRTDGLTGREAAAAIMIAVAAVVIVGLDHRAHYAPSRADLAILGTAWLLALVSLSRPPRVWISGALVVLAVHTALVIRDEGANKLSLAQLETGGYILAAFLVAFAALRPTLAMHTSITARRAWLASSSAAERAAAAAVLADRRSRRAVLEMEVLPLLRGIADGTLDPAAAQIRERCARQAAVLRQALTDSDRAPGAGELMTGLEPALATAGARGLLVNVQVIGDPGTPEPQVVRAVLAALDAVLGALPPHQVVLTVLAPGDDVELYLTFSEPFSPEPAPDVAGFGRDVPAAARWHATVDAEETGPGCLEIGWRKAGAA
jgi:hypothetical protein